MRSLLLPVSLTFFISALLCGCASSTAGTGVAKETKAFASATISDSSTETIDEAIREVFENDGFKFVSKNRSTYRFTKRGDKTTQVLYGSTWNTDFMSIEPEITVDDVGMGNFKLSCEVFIIEHTTKEYSDGSRHQLIRRGKKAYNDMLKRVKQKAER
ncbi:MAG: hypothetical protein ACPGKS_07380 [Coraliomargarita sp.]